VALLICTRSSTDPSLTRLVLDALSDAGKAVANHELHPLGVRSTVSHGADLVCVYVSHMPYPAYVQGTNCTPLWRAQEAPRIGPLRPELAVLARPVPSGKSYS
jgi:hypothetical protein